MGIDRAAYHRLECHALEDGKLNINAVPVRHADDMRCYGYVIECDGESIYYSGDSYEIPESILQRFRNERSTGFIRILRNFLPAIARTVH